MRSAACSARTATCWSTCTRSRRRCGSKPRSDCPKVDKDRPKRPSAPHGAGFLGSGPNLGELHMRKQLFGVLTAGVALALVAGGQSAAEPAPRLSQPEPMLAFLPAEAQIDWAAVHRNRESRKQS